jgi:hypothetical protein
MEVIMKIKIRIDKGHHRKLSDTKLCPLCGEVKTIDKFYKRSGNHGHLRRSWCIECEGTKQREQDKYRRRENERNLHVKRTILWGEWFRSLYGDSPKCQCCGKILKWTTGNKRHITDSVIFDHRNGGTEPIKILYTWLGDREVSEKNKNIFLSCDFGIICRRCNTSLPTRKRDQWLKDATRYVNGSS